MGTDDLFHKRRARQAKDLARKKARRDPYAKVLIVCEGSKTEPNYFEGLKAYYQLNSANVEITGESGSSPKSILGYAHKRYVEEKNAGDSFDRVYCVFDKDTHQSYETTCAKIKQMVPKDTFFAITSVPCFEYWLLLHFNYTTKPYEPLPGNSAANQVLSELMNNFLPDYKKGQTGVFESLQGQLEFAKNNAIRARKAAAAQHTDNPTTRVDELVDYLQHIKSC